jgi:hypothetical protein
MTVLGRVRLGAKATRHIWKVERHDSAGQPVARMRPEPLVGLIHWYPRGETIDTLHLRRSGSTA